MSFNWSVFWMLLIKLAFFYGAGAIFISMYIYVSRNFSLHCGSLDWAIVILSALITAVGYLFSTETSISNAIIAVIMAGLGVAIYYYVFMLMFIIIIGL